MLSKDTLQNAITTASKSGLLHGAFRVTPEGWKPRNTCLTSVYSSSERVICGILLAVYFEMHGRPDYVEVPDDREYDDVTDLVWPGSQYFVRALNVLSDLNAWEAIKMLIPH